MVWFYLADQSVPVPKWLVGIAIHLEGVPYHVDQEQLH